jgi:hypothetical protein
MTTQNKIEDAEYPYFCVNCKHHSFAQPYIDKEDYRYLHYCDHPQLLSLITGEKSECLANRCNATLCGRRGNMFYPKPGKNK